VSVAIRRARVDDIGFLVELLTNAEVEPFLAARRPKDAESILGEIERSEAEPQAFGLFVVEADGERAGTVRFSRANQRSRIADIGGLAVHPSFRGRRVGDETARLFQRHLLEDLGYHRLQLEIYAFNERALAHAERSGFVREGVRRKAYWRDEQWVDSVLYGLVAEDLADGS